MILASRAELLAYFKARNLGALAHQFNADGRLAKVFIDVDEAGKQVLVATGNGGAELVNTLEFPVHVSNFLGLVERDRKSAELLMAT